MYYVAGQCPDNGEVILKNKSKNCRLGALPNVIRRSIHETEHLFTSWKLLSCSNCALVGAHSWALRECRLGLIHLPCLQIKVGLIQIKFHFTYSCYQAKISRNGMPFISWHCYRGNFC